MVGLNYCIGTICSASFSTPTFLKPVTTIICTPFPQQQASQESLLIPRLKYGGQEVTHPPSAYTKLQYSHTARHDLLNRLLKNISCHISVSNLNCILFHLATSSKQINQIFSLNKTFKKQK